MLVAAVWADQTACTAGGMNPAPTLIRGRSGIPEGILNRAFIQDPMPESVASATAPPDSRPNPTSPLGRLQSLASPESVADNRARSTLRFTPQSRHLAKLT